MSWVFIIITVIVTDGFFFTTDHRGVVYPNLVGDFAHVRTTCRLPRCIHVYAVYPHRKECTASDCVHVVLYTQVVLLHTCTSITDCTYLYYLLPCVGVRCGLYQHGLTVLNSYGLLPCVRVRCGLYPHGLTVLFFWFSPLCESPLRAVSTWAYCCTLLVFSLV